ncbi:MAG: signal peptidase II [Bdellovibrionota bacterium]
MVQKILRRKWLILFVLTAAVIFGDQWTKLEVLKRFHLGDTFPIIPQFFSLTYIRNTGAAFGLLREADPAFRVPFFVIVPLAALAAIGWIFRKIPENDFRMSTALSLVIGGAVGNLIDRLTLGWVVDFLDFHWKYLYHFPAFNVADSAICVGVGILMLDLMTQGADAPARKGPGRAHHASTAL